MPTGWVHSFRFVTPYCRSDDRAKPSGFLAIIGNMWHRLFLFLSLLAFVGQGWAYRLPDLGAVATDAFSTQEEEAIGRMVMVQIREREPNYLDDPELEDYLAAIGRRLTEASDQPFRRYRFFVLRDNTINAFAMPGGYIGVHSGLILTAESESELAAVLAHEMGHVIHRHIAQLIDQQKTSNMVMLGSMLVAILAARTGGSQVAEAAAVGGQAFAVQQQLGFSRAFEHDADRTGLDILAKAGFDPSAAPRFFGRLLRESRLYENNAPVYMRTHPLTTDRISDLENRISSPTFKYSLRPRLDSLGFSAARAKLMAMNGTPSEAVARAFDGSATGIDRQMARVRAALRANDVKRARAAFDQYAKGWPDEHWRDLLEAEVLTAEGRLPDALAKLERAMQRAPEAAAPRLYAIDVALRLGQVERAEQLAREAVDRDKGERRYWQALGKVAAAKGDEAWVHRAQGESFVLDDRLEAAIDQFEQARRARRGDYFWEAELDAKIRMLKDEVRQRKRLTR